MASSKYPDALNSPEKTSVVREEHIETGFIEKLRSLKYTVRPDIHDRASLERNFREKFEALNRVSLTDGEFARLLEEIITPDVFTAARTLRERNSFTRDDGTPLNYTLVITAKTQKHEALKTHKKGLMQQLFPSPEEVEG